MDVSAAGDMAVYRSTYVYNFADLKTKKPTTENGDYLAGYRKQPNGSWKIDWSIASDTPPPQAAVPRLRILAPPATGAPYPGGAG